MVFNLQFPCSPKLKFHFKNFDNYGQQRNPEFFLITLFNKINIFPNNKKEKEKKKNVTEKETEEVEITIAYIKSNEKVYCRYAINI